MSLKNESFRCIVVLAFIMARHVLAGFCALVQQQQLQELFLFSIDTSQQYPPRRLCVHCRSRSRSHYRRICFSKPKHEDFPLFQLCCQVATTQITDTPRVCSIATALQHVATTVKCSVIITLWYESPVITLTYFSKCC